MRYLPFPRRCVVKGLHVCLNVTFNKYRELRKWDGDHFKKRVPKGNNRTEEMVMVSMINQW